MSRADLGIVPTDIPSSLTFSTCSGTISCSMRNHMLILVIFLLLFRVINVSRVVPLPLLTQNWLLTLYNSHSPTQKKSLCYGGVMVLVAYISVPVLRRLKLSSNSSYIFLIN